MTAARKPMVLPPSRIEMIAPRKFETEHFDDRARRFKRTFIKVDQAVRYLRRKTGTFQTEGSIYALVYLRHDGGWTIDGWASFKNGKIFGAPDGYFDNHFNWSDPGEH